MNRRPPLNEGRSIFPLTPLAPAKLLYSKRRVWWPAIFLANLGFLILWAIGSLAAWLWGHKLLALDWATVFFWRSVTLLGVIWLVYDRIYETGATLSVPASDPKWAFEFPFVITNPSHVFAIRNVSWICGAIRVATEKNSGLQDIGIAHGSKSVIEAGQVLNIDCLGGVHFEGGRLALKEGVIQIKLEYDADFFGLFSLHRTPIPTTFTWYPDASNPQWIKGESAR